MMGEEEKEEIAPSEIIDYSSSGSEAREAIASVNHMIALEQNAVSDKSRGLDRTSLDQSQEESKLDEIVEEPNVGFNGFERVKK